MAVNNDPIFSRKGSLAKDAGTGMNAAILLQANDYTGISANAAIVFTAGADGSYVQRLRFKAIGTNIATVARIYINNGAANTTATNNTFYGEVSLPATTAIATAATQEIDYAMNLALPPGWRLVVGLATAVASGWVVTPVAGDY